MDTVILTNLLVILLLILMNGFFSLSEMSFVSSQKVKLQVKAQKGYKRYKRVLQVKEQPGPYLSTIQIAITLIGILAGAFGGSTLATPLQEQFSKIPLLGPYAEGLAVSLVVLGITYFSIVLGELVPKRIALSNPEAIASFVFPILDGLALVFKPLVTVLSLSSGSILKIFRIRENPSTTMTEEDLHLALLEGQQAGIVKEKERTMVEGVFYLGDRPVETFMTYRSDVPWIDSTATPDELLELLKTHEKQHYFPVCQDTLDTIIGVVSRTDLFLYLIEKSEKPLKTILKKPVYIPETMSALKAFEVFKREDVEFILVMDEYGGFAGTITIRDLIEEIIGELSISDRDSEDIILREDGTFLLGGSVNIDDAADVLGFEAALPKNHEYHTLAGFILEIAGEIPRTGSTYQWQGYIFEIVDMDGNRIDKVIVKKPLKESDSTNV
ncbi:MAG: hemolysin family protein [Termitinemataceae bacterium]